ncbi:MAG: hypothetical protein NTV29_07275 [Planctomycetota bacterium]|nr:hypothetical protein [Planctomycetota bacterium]
MVQSNELPETPETYWRWGVPSLVLGGVTLVAMGMSHFFVEPRILSRYETMVIQARAFELKADPNANLAMDSLEWFTSMKKAELAAQRLMVHSPTEARYRRMHAEVASEIDRVGGRILANEPNVGEDSKRLKEFVMVSKNRAFESIRSATRLEGPDAIWAKFYILRSDLLRLRQSCRVEESQIQSMMDRAEQLSIGMKAVELDEILGSVDIQLAHRASPVLEATQREIKLRSGIACLESSLSNSIPIDTSNPRRLITKAWLVEGLASMDPKRAVREARTAIVEYSPIMQRMSVDWSSETKIEAIDAFFRCLMMVSGIEEASTSVLTRIDQILPEDQQSLRHTVVASELRALVAKSVFPEGAHRDLPVGALLRSMLRFGSDHPEVRRLLDQYYDENSLGQDQGSDPLVELLRVDTTGTPETFLVALEWTKQIMQRPAEFLPKAGEAMPEWSDRDIDGLVGLLAYWIQASRRRTLEWARLETICESFNQAHPQSFDLKIGAAVLSMGFQKWDIAISYLEKIGTNSSNGKFVEGLLEEARKQSSFEHATK